MSSHYYPVALDLRDRRILIVGAGAVAERKLQRLLSTGAAVTVIAPAATRRIAEWSAQQRVVWLEKKIEAHDLAGYALIFAATSDAEANREIAELARRNGQWVNVATETELCNFLLTAEIRRGPLSISVSTGGTCPALARELKAELEEQFGPNWERIASGLGAARDWLNEHEPDPVRRLALLEKLIARENLQALAGMDSPLTAAIILDQARALRENSAAANSA